MPWLICGLVPLLLWQHACADRDEQQPIDNTFRGYAEKDEGETVIQQLKELQRHLPKVEQAAQATREAAKKWAEGSLKEIDTTGNDLLSAAAVVAKNLKHGHQFIAKQVMGLVDGPAEKHKEAVTAGGQEEDTSENKPENIDASEIADANEIADAGNEESSTGGDGSLLERMGQADASDEWEERMPSP